MPDIRWTKFSPMRSAVSTAAGGAGDDREHGALLERLAVLDDQLDVDRGIGQAERRREDLAAAEDARLARDEVGARGRRLRG